jgi:hypothetical protein
MRKRGESKKRAGREHEESRERAGREQGEMGLLEGLYLYSTWYSSTYRDGACAACGARAA